MNAAQLTGMRTIHDETTSVCRRTKTAREMALTAHDLTRDGSMAITADGRHWVWDARFGHWAMWK